MQGQRGPGREVHEPKTSKKTSTATEKRKLRNRLSQQVFRARQASEINELKQRLSQFAESESSRNKRLWEENNVLRSHLWDCEKRLRSLQATLKAIVEGMTEAREGLPDVTSCSQPSSEHSSSPGETVVNNEESRNTLLQPAEFLDHDLLGILELSEDFAPPYKTAQDTADRSCEENQSATLKSICFANTSTAGGQTDQPILSVADLQSALVYGSSLDEEIEILPPHDALTMQQPVDTNNIDSEMLSVPLYRQLQIETSSKFSAHINAYEMCAALHCLQGNKSPDFTDLVRTLSSLVSTFVRVAWTSMEPWFKYTNGSETVAKLAAWRLYPCPLTLANVPQSIRPTQLQTAMPHPPIIDWCLFPFIRDKLIMHHSADPCLDDICRDIGQAYVIQADLKDLVVGAKSLAVKLSVQDIIHGMEHNPPWFMTGDNLSNTHAASQPRPRVELPAPSLQVLLHTREYAWELYRYLDLRNATDRICIDSSIFGKYPHLYQPDPAIALGVPLSASNRAPWSMPRPLDNTAMECYQSWAAYRGHLVSM